MDAIALVAFIGSMYLAGRIAERRGRSIKNWLWIAAFIGPFALPLLFLFPNLRGRDPKGPSGENRPADVISAVKPVIPGDPGHLNMSFASRRT
jgi:hypothetical protein